MPAAIEPPNAVPPAEIGSTPRASEPKPVDPREAAIRQALDERYEQFNAADINGKVAMFLSLLDGEGDPPMDNVDVSEMLSEINQLLARSNQRQRFDELIGTLRQKQPILYEEEKVRCLEWNIANRVAEGRWDELVEPVMELAALAGKDIDAFRRILDSLDFHGRLPLLVEAARIAWPKVQTSKDVVPWGVDEFAERASLYEIYEYLEQHPDATGEEEELLQRVLHYIDGKPGWVAKYLTQLMCPVPGASPLDLLEFDLRRRKPKRQWHDEDEDEDTSPVDEAGPEHALVDLSVTFLGWMHRSKNVALTRGEVGRREMVRFLLDRAEGELDDRRSRAESAFEPGKKPPKRPIEHFLCPDRARFEAYLAKLLDMMSWRYCDTASLVYITPLWLEFLELNGLLTIEQRQKAMNSLRDLLDPLRGLLARDGDDPHLIEALDTWAV
jgi:hypothetical protein